MIAFSMVALIETEASDAKTTVAILRMVLTPDGGGLRGERVPP